MRIKITADSTCDLGAALLEKHDITLSENESLYIQLVRSAYDISIYAKRMVNNFSVSIFGHHLHRGCRR